MSVIYSHIFSLVVRASVKLFTLRTEAQIIRVYNFTRSNCDRLDDSKLKSNKIHLRTNCEIQVSCSIQVF